MLGSAILKVLSQRDDLNIYGTLRSDKSLFFLQQYIDKKNIFLNFDVTKNKDLEAIFSHVKPDLVINCIGLIKQVDESKNVLKAIEINSMFPHVLSKFCANFNSRLIHFSTDCIFSGAKGNYVESDLSDAQDLYGKTKYLGELNYEHCITIRTSIIGHELTSHHGLIEWFLSQKEHCKGYVKAIFSGLPTIVLSEIIRDVIIEQSNLNGIYHISSNPISKYDLLKLVAKLYNKKIEIIPSDEIIIDRSLNSLKFFKATGYKPPQWDNLINIMFKAK
jgi:dTDP-4-dehydrorhamnose reductase